MARPTNYEKTIKGGCQVATSRLHSKIFYESTRHQLLQHGHIVALWALLWPSLFRRSRTWEIMFRKIQNVQEICFSRTEALHKSTKRHKLWWFSGAGTSAQTPLYRLRLVCYGLHKMASFLPLCPLPGYDGSPEHAQAHKLLCTGCVQCATACIKWLLFCCCVLYQAMMVVRSRYKCTNSFMQVASSVLQLA